MKNKWKRMNELLNKMKEILDVADKEKREEMMVDFIQEIHITAKRIGSCYNQNLEFTREDVEWIISLK